jgi:hypothetical protein
MSQDLAVVQPATLIQADDAPVPAYSGEQMSTALARYRELQRVFDREMPDAIMTIGNRQFRKRAYWRAVSVAFKLTVEPIEEHRDAHGQFQDGNENFGYLVTYRATAPNGRAATGDGSCFAVEKAGKFKCPHPAPGKRAGFTLHYPATACPDFDAAYGWRSLPTEATEHNVRAHAHTRAYNRAVSNLVGFGEVSAEEAQPEEFTPTTFDALAQAPPAPPTAPERVPGEDDGEWPPLEQHEHQRPLSAPLLISTPQANRLYAIAASAGWTDIQTKQQLLHAYGFESANHIPKSQYDRIVEAFRTAPSPRR